MKRKIVTLLMLSCMALSITACNNSKESWIAQYDNYRKGDVVADSETTNYSSMETTITPEEQRPTVVEPEITTVEQTASNSPAEIAEQVIFEQNGIKITATGLDENYMGKRLNLLLENNSPANITVQVRDVSVNGCMVDTIFSSDIATGKKNNDAITFMSSDFETYGITNIASIEFSFHIFNQENSEPIVDTDVIVLSTSIAGVYTQKYDDSGQVVYNENGVKIVYKGLTDDWPGQKVVFYYENNTDQKITIQARNTSVNGFMLDPIISEEITSRKKAIGSMSFLSSYIEDNNITAFEQLETSFHIIVEDGTDNSIDTEPIVINF